MVRGSSIGELDEHGDHWDEWTKPFRRYVLREVEDEQVNFEEVKNGFLSSR